MLAFLEANGESVHISDIELVTMTIELQRRAEGGESATALIGWIAGMLAGCPVRSRPVGAGDPRPDRADTTGRRIAVGSAQQRKASSGSTRPSRIGSPTWPRRRSPWIRSRSSRARCRCRKVARESFHGMSVYQAKMERKQGFLFRCVDVVMELFAMAATLSRARQMVDDRDPEA